MEPAVESAPVVAQASKQAKEGSKNRSRRRWRKGKVKGEPVAAWKISRTSCGGRGTGWTDPLPRGGEICGLTHCRRAWGGDVRVEYPTET